MRLGSLAFVTFSAAAIASSPASGAAPPPKCRSVELSVSAAADNIRFTNPPDQNNATAIREWLFSSVADPTGSWMNGTEHVSGVYTVVATYCEPRGEHYHRKHRTLQVLVHGMTYNKEMWAGFGFSDAYNWHAYATRAGYHTIALNRLGRGPLTHYPDPVRENQSALQDKLTQELLRQLRQGGFAGLRLPKFDKIVYVGHSFGSALGNHVARDNPGAADAYVLTGYSSTVALPINLQLDFASAAIVNPARFPGLPLGYWAGQNVPVRTSYCYAGNFDPALPQVDFDNHDTFAVGEGVSPGFEMRVTAFVGPVLVVTGDLDVLFCPEGAAACPETLERTRDLFPLANFSTMMPKDVGHSLTLHLSAPEVINGVHEWLDNFF
jgi:pimeloyl-ACP methyl ester carboxylesterase